MNTYERIEELRKKQGISQGKLEKELGISNGSIAKWKKSTPSPKNLEKIANFFCVSTDYLIKGVDFSDEKVMKLIEFTKNNTPDLGEEEYKIIELMGKMNIEQKKAVVSMVENMVVFSK